MLFGFYPVYRKLIPEKTAKEELKKEKNFLLSKIRAKYDPEPEKTACFHRNIFIKIFYPIFSDIFLPSAKNRSGTGRRGFLQLSFDMIVYLI